MALTWTDLDCFKQNVAGKWLQHCVFMANSPWKTSTSMKCENIVMRKTRVAWSTASCHRELHTNKFQGSKLFVWWQFNAILEFLSHLIILSSNIIFVAFDSEFYLVAKKCKCGLAWRARRVVYGGSFVLPCKFALVGCPKGRGVNSLKCLKMSKLSSSPGDTSQLDRSWTPWREVSTSPSKRSKVLVVTTSRRTGFRENRLRLWPLPLETPHAELSQRSWLGHVGHVAVRFSP